MASLKELLGDTVLGQNDAKVSIDQFYEPGATVGLYFSARWCHPCRLFTPVLSACYDKIKNVRRKSFEVIFVSWDRDRQSFEESFREMTWHTIGFESGKTTPLCETFEVQGIPCLVLLTVLDDEGSVKLFTTEGRTLVLKDKDGAEFPWTEK